MEDSKQHYADSFRLYPARDRKSLKHPHIDGSGSLDVTCPCCASKLRVSFWANVWLKDRERDDNLKKRFMDRMIETGLWLSGVFKLKDRDGVVVIDKGAASAAKGHQSSLALPGTTYPNGPKTSPAREREIDEELNDEIPF